MQNKQPVVVKELRTESRVPENEVGPAFYEEGPFWISLIALAVSFLSFRRTGRIAQANIFDKRFGDDLRALSRKLERELKELNAFIYPSDMSVNEQKAELSGVVAKIEDTGHQIVGILRELDHSVEVGGNTWQRDFEAFTADASVIFDGISDLTNTQYALFSLTVKKARDRWQSAIDQMRRRLERAKIKHRS
jgi:hypothetical protein